MKKYNICVVGATGLVGGEMLQTLKKRNFPVNKIKALATKKSAGTQIKFGSDIITVEEITPESFNDIDIALFSGGEVASEEYAAVAVEKGCIVIDNSAAFRMDTDVPLVVPEVNPHAVDLHKGIIANPNCSTIQMVVALKPIYDAAGIKRVVVSTYQSVSGTGKAAADELYEQTGAILSEKQFSAAVYPHQIAFNLIPQIGSFGDDGYSSEEKKMILETQKIFADDNIKISPTTVRVPVKRGHCEAVNIETRTKISAKDVKKLLENKPGIIVTDVPSDSVYPMPLTCESRDEVFIGRIREDLSVENGINMWVVSDNLLKGAALNAVQIAELLLERGLV